MQQVKVRPQNNVYREKLVFIKLILSYFGSLLENSKIHGFQHVFNKKHHWIER